MKRLLFLAAMCCAASLPAQLTVVAAHVDHVDLIVGGKIQLTNTSTVALKAPPTWTSGNKTVATVTTKGLVTARKKGYATITARATTLSGVAIIATVRVCVSPTARYAFSVWIDSVWVNPLPALEIGEATQAVASAHYRAKDPATGQQWGVCAHWYTANPAGPIVLGAAIGTDIP